MGCDVTQCELQHDVSHEDQSAHHEPATVTSDAFHQELTNHTVSAQVIIQEA